MSPSSIAIGVESQDFPIFIYTGGGGICYCNYNTLREHPHCLPVIFEEGQTRLSSCQHYIGKVSRYEDFPGLLACVSHFVAVTAIGPTAFRVT